MKRWPAKKQWRGLTAQSPRMYCHCETVNAARNRPGVLVCRVCRLVVWR
jgi:hypothetical protein